MYAIWATWLTVWLYIDRKVKKSAQQPQITAGNTEDAVASQKIGNKLIQVWEKSQEWVKQGEWKHGGNLGVSYYSVYVKNSGSWAHHKSGN